MAYYTNNSSNGLCHNATLLLFLCFSNHRKEKVGDRILPIVEYSSSDCVSKNWLDSVFSI